MRKTVLFGLITLLVATLCGGAAHAAQVMLTTAVGDGADTYVRGGTFRAANFGSDPFLVWKTQANTNGDANYLDFFSRVTFVRFDLRGVAGTVTRAIVRMQVHTAELPQAPHATVRLGPLPDGHVRDAAPGAGGWTESTLTLDHVLADGMIPNGSFGANLVTANGQIVEWDVTSFVQTDTNGLVTFAATGHPGLTNTARGGNFWSKENTQGGMPPTLELTIGGGASALTPNAQTRVVTFDGVATDARTCVSPFGTFTIGEDLGTQFQSSGVVFSVNAFAIAHGQVSVVGGTRRRPVIRSSGSTRSTTRSTAVRWAGSATTAC
jgi:hypothetical protein